MNNLNLKISFFKNLFSPCVTASWGRNPILGVIGEKEEDKNRDL